MKQQSLNKLKVEIMVFMLWSSGWQTTAKKTRHGI